MVPELVRPPFQERNVTRTSAAAVDKQYYLTVRWAVSMCHSLKCLMALKISMRHIVPPQGAFS